MNSAFILDCSVTMAWCFEDEKSPFTDSVLTSLNSNEALVPVLWQLEVTNVLIGAERKNRITEANLIHFIKLINQLPINIDNTSIPMADIFLLSKMHGLSSYDASYLYLAIIHGLPLATLDEKLKEASKKAGVLLYLT
jgi:predicted nucleic acid-binding protein